MTLVTSTPTNTQKKSFVYRTFTVSPSSTLYTPSLYFKVGSNSTQAQQADTDLSTAIPISNGTINDAGTVNMTGGTAGQNSTDNTTMYKQGGALTDNKAQNLIKDNTNVLATWLNANLAGSGSNCDATKYVGLWLYIKDATTLAKFVSLEIRIGADSTANYYSKTYLAAALTTGWNWLTDYALLSTWTATGTPGTLNDFQLRITTVNATDTFVAGDVVYDLLRQWQASDQLKQLDSGYPSIDLNVYEVQTRGTLLSTDAVGFNIDAFYVFNNDTTKLSNEAHTFTAESKSSTDEFVIVSRGRLY